MQTIAITIGVLVTIFAAFIFSIPYIMIIRPGDRLRAVKVTRVNGYAWYIRKKFLRWWIDGTDKEKRFVWFSCARSAVGYLDIHIRMKKKRRFRKDTYPILKPVHRNPHLKKHKTTNS